ncbi:MAG: NACHT domain-containing protein, partial [Cyanobacteria bacterium J06627_28]
MELSQVISIIGKAIAPAAAKQIQRQPLVIQTLKKCGLDPEHPPAEFSAVYNYALVEYALGDEENKPDELLQLFADKQVRAAFRRAFDEWNRTPLDEAVDARLDWGPADNEWNVVGNAIRDQKVDVQKEIRLFFAIFLRVVRRSQLPKEQMQTLLLQNLQRDIKQLKAQLAQVNNFATLPEQLGELIGQQLTGWLSATAAAQTSGVLASLSEQLAAWFEVLGYGTEEYRVDEDKHFECLITIPVRRKRYDRVVVSGVEGEAELSDLRALQASVEAQKADEGWLVSNMRVSSSVRKAVEDEAACEDISCFTLDELLDEDADFSGYVKWLEDEIISRGIDQNYMPLGCSKEEIDPKTKVPLGKSHYGEEEGWIEGYVDKWLEDSSKEHLSVLGEFGTGKTWFVMHYAWLALQQYQAAKKKGVARPRLPLVIPLRDYAKAVSMESLFSEFFFRKHEIPVPNYTAFEQLNKMGKLLLIFDGFDEMAARTDLQAMIDNFWELARVVVPGAKALLTCRTEHFPDAIEGRATLSAEKKASTEKLTGLPPQFEVLELAKFNDEQIAELLWRKVQKIAAEEKREPKEETVQVVMGNPQLLDLARRPVMVDLILDALPEIEGGAKVDMARVYLYAIKHKMEKDIRSERTFTSLADKLYFLCELSWKMISTDQMTLNYRAFPDELQQMFADRVKDEKELDHWRYDMMGQTMLIRNAEGDYSPAHRSLLEFFVAYKIVASLGAMAEDFTAIAQAQSHLDESLPRASYTWHSYFKRDCDEQGNPIKMAGLAQFESIGMDALLPMLGQSKLAKAVLDLAHPMLPTATMRSQLLPLLQATAQRKLGEVGYLGGNVAQLMLAQTPHALSDSDLSGAKLQGVDFSQTYLRQVNLQGAQLAETPFSKVLGNAYSVVYSPDGVHLAIGDSKGILQVWHVATGQVVLFCPGHTAAINSVVYSPDGAQLASGSSDKTVKLWNVASGHCEKTLKGHKNAVLSVVYSPDGAQLASGSSDETVKLWNIASGHCEKTLKDHENSVRSVAYSPDGNQLASSSDDKTVKLWNIASGHCEKTLKGHKNAVWSVAYSSDGNQLASGSNDNTVKLWNIASGQCERTLRGHSAAINSV